MKNCLTRCIPCVLAAWALVACGDNSENLPVQPIPASDAATDVQAEAAAEAASPEASPEAKAPEAGKPDADAAPLADPECAEVETDEMAVLFKAPLRGEGYLAAAAMIQYELLASKPNVEWVSPFPGCVAKEATDEELLCRFGTGYAGTKVTFIFGMNEHGGPTEPLAAWFSSVKSDETIVYYGEYYACLGKKVVGTLKDGKFEGALAPTDVPANANIKFTVP